MVDLALGRASLDSVEGLELLVSEWDRGNSLGEEREGNVRENWGSGD